MRIKKKNIQSSYSFYFFLLLIIFCSGVEAEVLVPDSEVTSQMSKGIAEGKLINEDKDETEIEQTVYISSSLIGTIRKGDYEVTIVKGLSAFAHRPIKYSVDFYYEQANIALANSRTDNWFKQGMKATMFDICGKFIEHFNVIVPVFPNPLKMEQHLVTIIDPTKTHTPLQKFGAGIGLGWDLSSPFATRIMKSVGNNLLQKQANYAIATTNIVDFNKRVNIFYNSTINLDSGIKLYETISKSNKFIVVISDAYNTASTKLAPLNIYNIGTFTSNNPVTLKMPMIDLSTIKTPSATSLRILQLPTTKMPIIKNY